MKSRTAIALLLAGAWLTLSALAVAQNTPAPDKSNAGAKMDALAFVQTAADVATNLHYGNLNDHLGIYIDSKNWAAALKDGDLGPFLKSQEAKPDRSAACFFSSAKDGAVCVYFDGEKAYGAAAVHAGANGKIEEKDITAAYKKVTSELLEKSGAKLRFQQTDVSTDEGVALPAFQVSVSPLG